LAQYFDIRAELYKLVERSIIKMKAKLMVIIAMAAGTMLFTSCTKYYNCKCVNYKGTITYYIVKAQSIQQANKNCDEKGNLGDCELN
jgi:hypothetical protein